MLESRFQTSITAEGMTQHLVLPDRMANKAIRDKIWSILIPRKRMKELADCLMKSSGLAKIPRKVLRALEPEDIVSQLLCSRESRYNIFGDELDFNYPTWLNLIMNTHERIAKKMPEGGVANLGMDYDRYTLNLEESSSSPDRLLLKTLQPYTDERNFAKLTFDEKDLADFVINTALGEIGDFEFIVDFMEKYPWCAERNSTFMEGVRMELAEARSNEESSGVSRPECGKRFETYVLNNFRKISAGITPGERLKLPNLLALTSVTMDMLTHEVFGLPVQLAECLNHQEASLVEYINHALKFANATSGFVPNERFAQCNELAAAEIEPIVIPSPISADIIKVLEGYVERLASVSDAVSVHPEALNDEIAEFRRLREEVSAAATAETMDVDILVTKTAQLKECNLKLNELANNVADLFLSIFENFSQLRLDLAALKADVSPEPAQPSSEPVSEPAPANMVDADEVAKKLEAAAEEITALELKNVDLSDQLDVAKKENHTLKLRIDSVKGASKGAAKASAPVLPFELETLFALMGRTRVMTPFELLTVFQAIAPDRVEVLPSAFESAKKADNFELGSSLSKLMEKLVYGYLDSITAGNPDSVARKVFSHSAYAAKESETVVSNSRLRAMREFTYKGEKILFLQHIGIGRNYGTQHAINLYFKILDGKVVIGHCGEHLETASTN
jgi:hypothetical protein